MTEHELITELEELFGRSFRLPTAAMAKALTEKKVPLRPYLTWLLKVKGQSGFRQNLVRGIGEYDKARTNEIQCLPQHIFNAGDILSRLTESSVVNDGVMETLERMCMPHAIYFLFASVGLPLGKYRKAAVEYASMFPEAVRNLPEQYKQLAEALIDGTA